METSSVPLLAQSGRAPYLDDVPTRPEREPGWQRVAHGVHARADEWTAANGRSRHRALIAEAAAQYGDDLVLVGASAAVHLGLPVLGPIPRLVQCLGTHGQRRRTTLVERRRTTATPPIVEVNGVLTTTPSTTGLDLARWSTLVAGVAALDKVLHENTATTDDVTAALAALPTGAVGARRAREAAHLADARAESPGESLSRVRMWQAGLPEPDLQRTVIVEGRRYRLDFLWHGVRVCGEFDGRVKYTRDAFGVDPQDAVWSERLREQALRRGGLAVARWTWDEAWYRDGAAMLAELARHGIRPNGRRW